MKKYILARVTMLAMMAAVCMTFTACGGDSDDDGKTGPGGGATGSAEYVEPCLDFGSSQSHVKEYMTGTAFQLSENSNEYTLLYIENNSSTLINYMFINAKLHMVGVSYAVGGESKALAFKSEIEKRYGVTMTRKDDPDNYAQFIYTCTVTINQRQVAIVMNCYAQGINIIYGLPD